MVIHLVHLEQLLLVPRFQILIPDKETIYSCEREIYLLSDSTQKKISKYLSEKLLNLTLWYLVSPKWDLFFFYHNPSSKVPKKLTQSLIHRQTGGQQTDEWQPWIYRTIRTTLGSSNIYKKIENKIKYKCNKASLIT